MKVKKFLLNSTKFWLVLIIFLGGFLRFYKLDWGEGYFFHPDEYHVAAAVNRLDFPSQMNPQLFSYGSFTVYVIYFVKELFSLKTNPIIIGRFISAFFSTLTILVAFLITKKITKNNFISVISALLIGITPGLIQQAHFTTPESNLIFFLMITLYLWTKFLSQPKLKFFLISALTFGVAVGVKIVALTFFPVAVIVLILDIMSIKSKPKIIKIFLRFLGLFLVFVFIAGLSYFATFPFSIIDWPHFISSLSYETKLGRGILPVFYTRQFIETLPIIFQFQKILPFALNPVIILFGILGFFLAVKEISKNVIKQNRHIYPLLITTVCFIFYFIPNAFLFAKWTRFIAPSFPFFSIFTAYSIYHLSNVFQLKKIKRVFLTLVTGYLLLVTLVWTNMFFSIYSSQDVRLIATTWVNNNLPADSFILTEAGNMLEVPVSGKPKMSFDLYHLDENSDLQDQLPQLLERADYFVIQSRRMFMNHQRLPNQFPITSNLYDQLFNGNLGFGKIKEFDSYPKLVIGHWLLVIPDEVAEETWSVFDHPVIRIYKKVKPLTIQNYEKILKI